MRKNTVFILLLPAVLFVMLINPAIAQWHYMNPRPTPEGFSAVSFPDPVQGFAVTYNGLMLSTTDGGLHWDFLPPHGFSKIYCTDIDFVSGTTGLVVASGGLILRTGDGGMTWDSIPSGTGNDLLSIFMYTASTGYITGARGVLLKTIDGGNTWQHIPAGVLNDFFDCWFTSAETGYIAANQMLLKTIDGGLKWNEVLHAPQGAGFTKVCFVTDVTGISIGKKGGIFRTADAGISWQQIPPVTSENLNGIDFLSPEILLIAANSGKILRSEDSGISWNVISTDFSYNFSGVARMDNVRAVACGPLGAIWRSSDSGSSWQPVTYFSLDQFNTVSVTDPNTVLVAGAAGRVFKTMDGGETWKKIASGTSQNINDLVMASGSVGYLAGDLGLVMKTNDGGESWSMLNSPAGYYWRSLSFSGPDQGLMVGTGPVIFRTHDGGVSWTGFQTGSNEAMNSVSILGTTAFACGSNASLFKSTDAGASWFRIVVPELMEANLNKIQYVGQNICYVTGNQYILNAWVMFLARTADGGNSWTVKTFTYYPDRILKSMYFTGPATGYLSGSDFLWKSVDGGDTWFEQKPPGATLGPNAICFSGDKVGYAVGYSGQVIKTVNGGGLSAADHDTGSNGRMIKNYPNPASGRTNFVYHLRVSGLVKLMLYDVNGRPVATIIDQFLMAGRHDTPFDMNHLNPGIYFYRIITAGNDQLGKMVVY